MKNRTNYVIFRPGKGRINPGNSVLYKSLPVKYQSDQGYEVIDVNQNCQ